MSERGEGERTHGGESRADAGLTEGEREGMDLLGRESVRDGAISGVSGLGDEVRAGERRNPPQLDDVNNMAGDVSQSGGAAGGFGAGAAPAEDELGEPDPDR